MLVGGGAGGVHRTLDVALAIVSSESAVGDRCDGGDHSPGNQCQDEDTRAGAEAGAVGREGRRLHRSLGEGWGRKWLGPGVKSRLGD